jgi:hypothetical protein
VILKMPKALQNYSQKRKSICDFLVENFDDLVKILLTANSEYYDITVKFFSTKQNTLLVEKLISSQASMDCLSNGFITGKIRFIEGVSSILINYIQISRDYNNVADSIQSSETFLTNMFMNLNQESIYQLLDKIVCLKKTTCSSFVAQFIINLCDKWIENDKIKELKDDFNFEYRGVKFMSEACFDIGKGIGNFWRICYTFISTHPQCESFKKLIAIFFNYKEVDAKCKSRPFDYVDDLDAKTKATTYHFKCAMLLDRPINYLVSLANKIIGESDYISYDLYAEAMDYIATFKSIDMDEQICISAVRKCLLIPYRKGYIDNRLSVFTPSQHTIKSAAKLASLLKDKSPIRSTLLFWDSLNINSFTSRATAKAFTSVACLNEGEEDKEFDEFVLKYSRKELTKGLIVDKARIMDDIAFFEKQQQKFK